MDGTCNMTGTRSNTLAALPALATMLVLLSLPGIAQSVMAQQAAIAQQPASDYYHPLHQNLPPGKAAAWLNHIRQYDQSWMQPISVEAPAGATVSVYSGSARPLVMAPAPTLAAVNVGHVYRLRVTGMTDFPDTEVYPTVELLDRLHPPTGREFDFPIPVIITDEDIRTVRDGQLITRVIYLEQPQFAQVNDPLRRVVPQQLPPSENTLREADRLGRPMAILRIGGRTPTAQSPDSFFGTGGALVPGPTDAGIDRVSLQRTRSVRPAGMTSANGQWSAPGRTPSFRR
ncbi:MAG: hypothetical protein Fues2KO_48080 [Fuerstiella sp.]